MLGDVGQLPLPLGGRVVRHGEVADPWPFLCGADVVVAAAGDATIADVAAARAPLVAVPQPRPYAEQTAHVAILADQGLCVAAEPWPDRRGWRTLLDRAGALGGAGWAQQADGLGAHRAAAFLQELAADRQGVPAGV